MRNFLLGICVFILICGCSMTNTIGNGKVDPIEESSIRVAVGLAFQSNPNSIIPAYAVSTAILELLESDSEIISVSIIDQVISNEVEKLNLDEMTKQSFFDLVLHIKANIESEINLNMTPSEKVLVVHDIVKIIQQSAFVRLSITK